MHRYHAVTAICAVRAETPPAWLYAIPGTRAVLGTDGEDNPVALVCKTAQDYDTMDSGKTIPENSCEGRTEGTIIVIDSIVPEGATCDQARALLGIHAADGSWKGYAGSGAVYPLIPTGTLLTLKRFDTMHATIANDRSVNQYGGTDVGNSATVKFISFKPSSFGRDLLVTVESGPHAGLRGWTFLAQTLVAGKDAYRIFCPVSKH